MGSRDRTTAFEDCSTVPKSKRPLRLITAKTTRISTLANLHALTDKLHGTRGRLRVLQTIQSIAMGLSGSDEVAVFEVDPAGGHLVLVSASGIDASELKSIPMGIGLIGRAVDSGELYERFCDPDASLNGERHLRACVPLKMDRTPIGAIAIFDGHGHYLIQEPLNREWIDIFANHAASALYWTGIYETAIAALNSDW
jgi:GAF domain-containing protein